VSVTERHPDVRTRLWEAVTLSAQRKQALGEREEGTDEAWEAVPGRDVNVCFGFLPPFFRCAVEEKLWGYTGDWPGPAQRSACFPPPSELLCGWPVLPRPAGEVVVLISHIDQPLPQVQILLRTVTCKPVISLLLVSNLNLSSVT
jgi:hypothetical protein